MFAFLAFEAAFEAARTPHLLDQIDVDQPSSPRAIRQQGRHSS
ncbi:hypothetical protein ABZ817_26465 [Streptomyces antimycoticus]